LVARADPQPQFRVIEVRRSYWRRALRRIDPLSTAALARGSVRGKLMRVVLLTTAIALTVTGIALLTHEMYVYRTTGSADLSTEAAILALSTAPALAFDDYAVAERNLRALQVRRRVMVAALYSSSGQIYASFVREGEAPPPPMAPPPGVRISGERIELAQLVERDGEVLGTIYLRARYDVAGRVEDYLGIFVLVTLLSLLAAFLLSKRLQKGITEPLDAIAAVAREIVGGRDYSLRATKASDDEIGVVVDAFNKMLEEVQARSSALREADRRKDEFLATLAHELRNPLAPIRQSVKLLESASADEPSRQWAGQVISRQVQRMALLLDDLLDVSRITRGRLDLKLDTVDLEALIEAAVETVRPHIDSKQHRLSIELPAQPVTLAVDPLRLSQSLSNLLTNAAKYTDTGGDIHLKVALSCEGINMSVKDNGIGFESGASTDLFEMFSQVDSAITRSEGGLGIGLALVKGLIGLHGGTVEGYSAGPGLGSEFTIRLPRSAVLASAAQPAPAPRRTRPDAKLRVKVLVADDNRDAADSLALLLQMNGHDVLVGHTGEEALQIAARASPHAMILDIGMPDINGYEVARRTRAEVWGAHILLIAVTGWGQQDDKNRANAAGFDHHMTKPVDPEHIERLLQEFFGARARDQTLESGDAALRRAT
jgi:signal transduction histidine kinase/ActR/RegA family two-component response regulator